MNISISSCPFVVDECTASNEFEFSLGQTQNVEFTDNYKPSKGNVCAYKVVATSGAPGFKIEYVSSNKIQVSWIEYDLGLINPVSTGSTWPDLHLVTTNVECPTTVCAPGQLLPRERYSKVINANYLLREFDIYRE